MARPRSDGQGNGNQTTTIGDIITAIDGHAVAAVPDLTSYLNSKQPGDEVTLTIHRNGSEQTVKLTLPLPGPAAAHPTTTNLDFLSANEGRPAGTSFVCVPGSRSFPRHLFSK